MEVVPDAVIPGNRIEAKSTIVAELTFNVFNRTDNANNYKWLRNGTTATITARGAQPTISSCDATLNLHDNAQIQDCQISAFMSPFAAHPPPQIRSTSSAGWRSHVRSGHYANHRYVTVLFGKLKYVTRLMLYSDPAVSQPTEIGVYKTMDGRAFTKVAQRAVVWDSANNASFSLGKKILMRGIRVALTKASNEDETVSLRMDLFGCDHANTSQKFDPCTTKEYDALPTSPPSGHYLRGYLHTGTFLLYCDYIPVKNSLFKIVSRCFKALDSSPSTWTDLGPLVGNILSFNDHGTVYGLSPDAKSYVMSTDFGDTWQAVNVGKYENDKSKGFSKNATSIPWESKAGFNSSSKGTSCTAYASTPWNLCYDGIYHTVNNGSAPVVSWNSCCL